MKRKILTTEKIYRRVRDFITILPSEVLASLRIFLSTPSCIDDLRVDIRVGIFSIKHDNWGYNFQYGEKEFDELMRQAL